MISQRDISAFFTILDVLSDPEKAKAELKVLADMRESVDKDLLRVGQETQNAQNMLTESKNLQASASLAMHTAQAREKENAERAGKLAIDEQKNATQSAKLVDIAKDLETREKAVIEKEAHLDEKIKRYETSYADYLVRNEALRKNEADYRERVNKLKAIAN